MATTTRRANRYPLGSSQPDVPLWMHDLAVDLDDAPRDNQGVIGSRPTATPVAPRSPGEWWTSTNEEDPAGTTRRRVYRGHGTGYDELATVPVTDRMLASPLTGGASSFSAHLPADTPIGANSTITLTGLTETYDIGGNFDGSVYTAPVDGLYEFGTHAILLGINANTALQVYLAFAGTPGTLRREFGKTYASAIGQDPRVVGVAPPIQLSEGDAVVFRAANTDNTARSLDGGGAPGYGVTRVWGRCIATT